MEINAFYCRSGVNNGHFGCCRGTCLHQFCYVLVAVNSGVKESVNSALLSVSLPVTGNGIADNKLNTSLHDTDFYVDKNETFSLCHRMCTG